MPAPGFRAGSRRYRASSRREQSRESDGHSTFVLYELHHLHAQVIQIGGGSPEEVDDDRSHLIPADHLDNDAGTDDAEVARDENNDAVWAGRGRWSVGGGRWQASSKKWLGSYLAICCSILLAGALNIVATSLTVDTQKHWAVYLDMPELLTALSPIVSLHQLLALDIVIRHSMSKLDDIGCILPWKGLLLPMTQSATGSVLLSALSLLHHYHLTLRSISVHRVVELTASCAITSSLIVAFLSLLTHQWVRVWRQFGNRLPGVEFFLLPLVASLATLLTCLVLPAVAFIFHYRIGAGPASCASILYTVLAPMLIWMLYLRLPAIQRKGWLGPIGSLLFWCVLAIAIDSNLWMYSGHLNRLLCVVSGTLQSALMIHFHELHVLKLAAQGEELLPDSLRTLRARCFKLCCQSYSGTGLSSVFAGVTLLSYPVFMMLILLGLRAAEVNATPLSFTGFSMVVSHGLLLYIGHTVNRNMLTTKHPLLKRAGWEWMLPFAWLLFERLSILMHLVVILVVDNIIQGASAWTIALLIG